MLILLNKEFFFHSKLKKCFKITFLIFFFNLKKLYKFYFSKNESLCS